MRGDAEPAAVHPDQAGPFELGDREIGQMLPAEIPHAAIIGMQVADELIQPLGPLVVGGPGGKHAERIDVADLVVVDGAVDPRPASGIGRDDVCDLQPGDIERLAGGDAGHAVMQKILRKRGKRRVAVPRENQFAMDLVGYDHDVVAEADLADPEQFGARPDPADGVVGIAQQHQLHPRIGGLRLQVVVIDHIGIADRHQRRGHDFASVVADRREEAVVDRRLDEHLVSGNGQRLDDGRQGRHHPRQANHPVALDPPAVAGKPPRDGLIIALRNMRIAEDAMLDPTAEGLRDRRRRPEIHVGHPHGQNPLRGRTVPLAGVGSAARNRRVEIVLHCSSGLS